MHEGMDQGNLSANTGVINDPPGQPTVPAGSDFCMIMEFVTCVRVRTTYV